MILSQFTEFVGSCMQGANLSHGLVGGLFLMGLVGGFTHCVGMCGPFVMVQTGTMKKLSDASLLSYHVGRIITYTILALIMFSMVNVISFFSPLRIFIVVPLLALSGLLFLVNGMPRLQVWFPWVEKISMPIPLQFVQRIFVRTKNRFLMGLVLGLMPCGMVMAAMMAASTAPNYAMAGLSMMAFGVGTIPALVFAAWGGIKLQQQFPNKMRSVRSGLMIWSGIWLFAMAGVMILRG